MQLFRSFPIKIGILAILGLFLIGLIPESLYSQTDTAPKATTILVPAKKAYSTPRSTTSLYPDNSVQESVPHQANMNQPEMPGQEVDLAKRPNMATQAVLLGLLSLFPFIIMILTSFLKIVVVLSLLRTALGVQNAPPNQVLNGVAFLLSLFIMYPTAMKMYDAAETVIHQNQIPESFVDPNSSVYVIKVAGAAIHPLKDFFKRNSSVRHQAIFFKLAYRGLPTEYKENLKPDDLMVLVPSYITSQLKDAFEIGVLIYIPFFVIDLVTSNILLAMGMMMLSPVTISMPLKLFLLVMLDGWTLLIEGLVKTFI